jgi:putative transposase
MSLVKNQILRLHRNDSEQRKIRVLHIEKPHIIVIELVGKVLPDWWKYGELEMALMSGSAEILQIDPYASLLLPSQEYLDKHRTRRDQAWEVISPIIDSGISAFIPAERQRLIEIAASIERPWCKPSEKYGRQTVSEVTVRNYLRAFWQRGQNKNALLQLYFNCGAPGETRVKAEPGPHKRGRKSDVTKQTGKETSVNVTTSDLEKFDRGIRKFYLDSEKKSLTVAHQRTLEEFYNIGYEFKKGVLTPILPEDTSTLPTIGEFRYWFEQRFELSKVLIHRKGKRKYDLENRDISGSPKRSRGPGSCYQIDAMIGNLHLVSWFDRNRRIGRPVVYFVVDEFSWAITGWYVGLEGPSWLGMMMALEHAFTPKVEAYKKIGIDITEEEYPCQGICNTLVGDRGELLSKHADNLADSSLNIRVDNTAHFRADWKCQVEKIHDLAQDDHEDFVPGGTCKPLERGERDPRLDAALDIFQYRQLIGHIVLKHNTYRRLENYPFEEDMIRDQVAPYPLDLWNWGIVNRTGCLNEMPIDLIRLNLLPSAEASVTERGIYFYYGQYKLGLYYTCETAIKEEWFVRARYKSRWKITIAYDPRDLSNVYLRPKQFETVEVCRLLPRSKIFQGRNLYEAADYLALKGQASHAAQTRDRQGAADYHAQMDHIINTATEQTQKAYDGRSKSAQTSGIRPNRMEARDDLRSSEAWRPNCPEAPMPQAEVPPNQQISQDDDDDEEYVPRPKNLEKYSK